MVATTSATCSSPLSCGAFDVLTGGGAISISQSNGGTNGYLSSTDWTLFNNKVGSTSLSATSPLGYTSATGVFTCTNCLNTANAFGPLGISSSGSTYNFTGSSTPTFGQMFATSTATSTFIGGLNVSVLNLVSSTASSTGNNGFSIQNGCFAIRGVCVGGGTGITSLNGLSGASQTF